MSNSTEPSSGDSSASMLHGHAAYVSGAVQEQIGNLTSSPAWKESGQSVKSDAVDEMRSAKQASDSAKLASRDGKATSGNPTIGMAERKLGAVTGCEGMEQEGLEKQRK